MDYRAQIQQIRSEMLAGRITYAEAKAKVKPLLDEMNAKGAAISKEHGMRFKPLSFAYVMR